MGFRYSWFWVWFWFWDLDFTEFNFLVGVGLVFFIVGVFDLLGGREELVLVFNKGGWWETILLFGKGKSLYIFVGWI